LARNSFIFNLHSCGVV